MRVFAARNVPRETKLGNHAIHRPLVANADPVSRPENLRRFIEDRSPDAIVHNPFILRIENGKRNRSGKAQ
jgi:hypothetical protein